MQGKSIYTKTPENKKTIGIQATFISEYKLQKVHFFAKYNCFFGDLCVHFEPLLGCECAYVCHDLRNKKEGIYFKKREYKRSKWHTSDLYLRN